MSEAARRIEDLRDVAVVGAGPAGLTPGCAPRRRGVYFRILEERTRLKPNSRTHSAWARPQELLDSSGVRAALAERSPEVEKQTQFLGVRVTPSRALSKPSRRA